MVENMRDMAKDSVVPCVYCGQWGVVYTQCGNCGAPIERVPPDPNESPLVACDYCNQFGMMRDECQYCGAPMPDKYFHISGPYWASEDSPYWADGGVSLRSSDFGSDWATS